MFKKWSSGWANKNKFLNLESAVNKACGAKARGLRLPLQRRKVENSSYFRFCAGVVCSHCWSCCRYWLFSQQQEQQQQQQQPPAAPTNPNNAPPGQGMWHVRKSREAPGEAPGRLMGRLQCRITNKKLLEGLGEAPGRSMDFGITSFRTYVEYLF